MARQDAEIAADIGDDGADRPAAHLSRDLLCGGQVGEAGVRRFGCPSGGRRPGRGSSPGGPRSRVEVGSALEYSRLERIGEEQAMGDAREDQREIGGAEADLREDGLGGGVLADGGGDFAA